MIPVYGLKGQLTVWTMHRRSAFGVLKTMGDHPSTIPIKAFASNEMTEDEFAANLANLDKGVYITLDAHLQSEAVTNSNRQVLKHPDSQREMYQHFLRIRSVDVISPAYRVSPSAPNDQRNEDQARAGEYASEPHWGEPSPPIAQGPQVARAAAPPMPDMPALPTHAAAVPWKTVSA